MNDQPTPPTPDAGGTLPPPTPPAPRAERNSASRTRQIAAVAAVAAGVAITGGIAVAARDDAAASPSTTTATSGSASDEALPAFVTDTDDANDTAVGDLPDLGAMPARGEFGDRHGDRHDGGRHGEHGGAGEAPSFDQSGGDATAATPGQMPQNGAPDAASQGS